VGLLAISSKGKAIIASKEGQGQKRLDRKESGTLEEKYETYAYFSISGFDCNHTEISNFLGLEPTKAGNKGEIFSLPKRPEIKLKRRHSVWTLYSPKPKSEIFLNNHIEALLEVIEPKQVLIKELTTRYDVGIQCAGFYNNVNPGFHLSNAIIKRVAELNLWIDFDLYCFCEGDSDKDAK
jgi:tetrahydromethanopterin S-methyltransferase subunit B